MELKNVLLVVGGTSSEHEISLISGNSIQQVIDQKRYKLQVIGIDKQGIWWHYPQGVFADAFDDPKAVHLRTEERVECFLKGGSQGPQLVSGSEEFPLHVALPILHGPGGEDGVIQGYFETVGLPYIGCGVGASAACIDKQFTKDILRSAGLPVADGVVVMRGEQIPLYDELASTLVLPLYVKPACQGSSVGVNRASNQTEFLTALNEAFSYDDKVLVEGAVVGREIECAVLEIAGEIKASPLGEIKPADTFYDFESKYVNQDGADLIIPAPFAHANEVQLKEAARKAFSAVGGSGLARVDFLVRDDGTFVINEINTMPGFTSISMYPKLWEHGGLTYKDLLQALIDTALVR